MDALSQFRRLWASLSLRQRISIGVAGITLVGGLFLFASWRKERSFQPLYTSMNAEDAGSVVTKLKESGTEYRVSDGGASVLVPADRVAEARLALAAAGLPKSGRIGFELFDQTNLGTTDFAEQVNFRRALEGELERSIRSVGEVEQARVHLTFARQSVFIESRMPAKASVLISLRSGAQLAPANVTAITHLVASAVDGLHPSDVSVMDASGNLLSRPKSALDSTEASDELIDYRRKLEKDLLAKATSTLDPLVGPGRYRMELSVDCDFSTGEQSDEVYDPEKSVMLSSQKTEETNGSASSGGVPGTGANLPRPAPRMATGGASTSRRTENVTYQSSRTVRRVKLPQGSIRRISASLLLDQAGRWENQNGRMERILTPPSPESVRAIRELVTAALGLVPARGDHLVIESLPFESTLHAPPPAVTQQAPTPAAPAPASRFAIPVMDWRVWSGIGVAAMLLISGLWWLRRRQKRKRAASQPRQAGALAGGAGTPPLEGRDAAALSGSDGKTRAIAQALDKLTPASRIEVLIEELRNTIDGDPELAASVLRCWIEEEPQA